MRVRAYLLREGLRFVKGVALILGVMALLFVYVVVIPVFYRVSVENDSDANIEGIEVVHQSGESLVSASLGPRQHILGSGWRSPRGYLFVRVLHQAREQVFACDYVMLFESRWSTITKLETVVLQVTAKDGSLSVSIIREDDHTECSRWQR